MPDQDKLRVGSVCSGVGGFELGLHRADPRFDIRWMCEFLERRRKVLNRHWPGIPVHHDITELDPDDLEPIDLLVGGTPCQDLSVAGKRGGLEGERSGLFWHFIRLRNSLVPRWTLWENVPGSLSSNGGMDFALVLGAFVGSQCHVPAGGWPRAGMAAGPWGGCVWRTLNSQHFGVPQRRHRVFVVGCFGGMVPSEVLFERQSGEGDSATREETRARSARDAREEPKRPGSVGTPGGVTQALTGRFGNSGPDLPDAEAGWLVSDKPDVAPALTSRYYKGVPSDGDDAVVYETPELAAPLTRGSAAGNGVSEPGCRQEDDTNLVAHGFDGTQDTSLHEETSPAVRRGGEGTAAPMAFVQNQRDELRELDQASALQSSPGSKMETRLLDGPQVRRLTPTECERLQGFPDGWTIPKGNSLLDAPSHYQLTAVPPWEGAVFTKRHAVNDEDDYESWEEAEAARTLVEGRLNGTLAVSCVHADAIGRDGEAQTPSPDAEGRVRLRDAGLGVRDDGQAYNLTTGAPHAVGPVEPPMSIRTAQQGANGIGLSEEATPAVDETGAGAVAHALTSEGFDASEDGTGRGTSLVAAPLLRQREGGHRVGAEEAAGGHLVPEIAPTVRTQQRNNSNPSTEADMLVADGIGAGAACLIDPLPDAHRYAAMGDAVTVPVISFIGSRIAALEDGRDPDGHIPL